MNDTGEQLHPNWRALATVHIPLKRFIKEGTKEVQSATLCSREKYEISKIDGDEIKQFYEELITKNDNEQTQNLLKRTKIKINRNNCRPKQSIPKTAFEVRNYFRYAMENNVDELKKINFEDKNCNVCDNYGWSALMMASCAGAYEAVKFLLKIGVDRCIKDKTGRTARDLAYRNGYLNVVYLLENNDGELDADIQEEDMETHQPFYCEICKQNFEETSKSQHYTSTVHQFHIKSNLPANKLQKFNITSRNKGLQLMVKQGWDKESGLGPSQSGRLYPVKTVIRKQRTGLGIEQDPARVTHFESYDHKAVINNSSDYYNKKHRNRNDIKREKVREWKRDRRLRNELN